MAKRGRKRKIRAEEEGRACNGGQTRDEPQPQDLVQSSPIIPNLTVYPFVAVDSPSEAYSNGHPQAVPAPCATLRVAKRIKEEENENPIDSSMATPVDGTFPGNKDVANAEDCHLAAASASLDQLMNNVVTSVLPRTQNSAAGHSRYSLRHAGVNRPKRASLRIAARVLKNDNFINLEAESADGSSPMTENVPTAENHISKLPPQGQSLEESNPDPSLEHLNSTSAIFEPVVTDPAASIVYTSDPMTLKEAEMEPTTFTEKRLEESNPDPSMEPLNSTSAIIEPVVIAPAASIVYTSDPMTLKEAEMEPTTYTEKRLEESNPDPSLEHLNSTSAIFEPVVTAPAACIVYTSDPMTLKEAEMEPTTYTEKRLEENGDRPSRNPAACIVYTNDPMTLKEAEMEPPTYNEKRLEENGDRLNRNPAACIVYTSDPMTLKEAEMEPPTNTAKRLEENGDSPSRNNGHLPRSLSFNLSEMVDLMDDDSSSQSEVDYPGNDHPLVTVEGYRVEAKWAPTLRLVLSKHGDIAANSFMESLKSRSFFLELICEVIKKLENSGFAEVTVGELKRMRTDVEDAENARFNVDWLGKRLDDILDAKQKMKQSSNLKEERDKSKEDTEEVKKILETFREKVRLTEKELEAFREKVRLTEKELEAFREKVRLTEKVLAIKEAEATNISDRISKVKEMVKCFYKRSLVEGLL